MIVSIFSAAHGLVLFPAGIALLALTVHAFRVEMAKALQSLVGGLVFVSLALIGLYFLLPGYNGGRVEGAFLTMTPTW